MSRRPLSHKYFEVSVSFFSLSAALGRCQALPGPDARSLSRSRSRPPPGPLSAAAAAAEGTLPALLQSLPGSSEGGGTRGQGWGGAVRPGPLRGPSRRVPPAPGALPSSTVRGVLEPWRSWCGPSPLKAVEHGFPGQAGGAAQT